MSTLLIAVGSFVGFIVAYHTYGRWLGRKIFRLDPSATCPSTELADGMDYVPTRKEVIFGHHFTSIAGTGPIVGPAIAVFWGWLPALLWVLLGSIFIGAVHDFGAMVISIRNQGKSVGQIAGSVVSPRAKILFLLILLLALTIVLAIFGLVIAIIFSLYPESVLSVWIEIPLAVAIGFWVYKKKGGLLWPSLAALGVMYVCIWIGTFMPLDIGALEWIDKAGPGVYNSPFVVWTVILFVYCFIASVLPVWSLLQPRDYINSHELFLALGLLVVGLAVAGVTGQADLFASAPAIAPASQVPADAPPIWPFLFITVACGAVSGFHSLVSSGTSSKQVSVESHAQLVGYGSMILEGALAVVVILACCAGVGMGLFQRQGATSAYRYVPVVDTAGAQLTGHDAWRSRYQLAETTDPATGQTRVVGWANHKLGQKIGAFIEGGSNFLCALGIGKKLAVGILAVLVASFAATTNRYAATAVALVVAAAVAIFTGAAPGAGGMILWPMFGALNQLLAGLVFLVVVFYLLRRGRPVWFAVIPMVIMIVLPAWAMLWKMFNPQTGWLATRNYLLLGFGAATQVLLAWLIVEALIVLRNVRGGGLDTATIAEAETGVTADKAREDREVATHRPVR
ncbi:MAG: carbon starvation CstA family protein [Planctomycetota bacterium]|jgi:carbon starvation protein